MEKKIAYNKVFYQRNIDLGIDVECHECTSHSKNRDGYIQLNRDGFTRLHRWIHWKTTGSKPEVVMHKCDNPSCINPAHLKSGTHIDNMKDMVNKGRAQRSREYKDKMSTTKKGKYIGEKNPSTKLTDFKVWMIKGWLLEGCKTKDIAKAFNTTPQIIGHIKHNRHWKHITFDLLGVI